MSQKPEGDKLFDSWAGLFAGVALTLCGLFNLITGEGGYYRDFPVPDWSWMVLLPGGIIICILSGLSIRRNKNKPKEDKLSPEEAARMEAEVDRLCPREPAPPPPPADTAENAPPDPNSTVGMIPRMAGRAASGEQEYACLLAFAEFFCAASAVFFAAGALYFRDETAALVALMIFLPLLVTLLCGCYVIQAQLGFLNHAECMELIARYKQVAAKYGEGVIGRSHSLCLLGLRFLVKGARRLVFRVAPPGAQTALPVFTPNKPGEELSPEEAAVIAAKRLHFYAWLTMPDTVQARRAFIFSGVLTLLTLYTGFGEIYLTPVAVAVSLYGFFRFARGLILIS